MRYLKLMPLLLMLILAAGCGFPVSLHPLYSEKDTTFDASLLGAWITEDGETTYVFKKKDATSYQLLLTCAIDSEIKFNADGSSSVEPVVKGANKEFVTCKCEAHLVKLGKHLFLDICPEESSGSEPVNSFFWIRGHVFLKISIEKDSLRISYLNEEWLKEKLTAGKIKLAHEFLEKDLFDGRIIITAQTKALRKFISKYAEDKEAFPEQDKLHRKN